jgi:hypothetical protein
MEERHVSTREWQGPPPSPISPKPVLPLKQLWAALPTPIRQQALRILGRVIVEQITAPRAKEVPHERR